MTPLYFITDNTALALALTLAGQQLVRIRNEYTEPQLRGWGCTAREAWARKLPGKICYYFEPGDDLNKLVTAWWDECGKLKTGDGSTLDVTPEEVIRIVAACLTQRKAFTE